MSLFLMIEPQTSFLINAAGLFIEILGAWSLYAALPKKNDESGEDFSKKFFEQIRKGCFNLGLFFTIGMLMRYISSL